MNPRRGGHDQCATWWAQGKAAPMAWVIGAEPAFQLAAVATMPTGMQEMGCDTAAQQVRSCAAASLEDSQAAATDCLIPVCR